MKFNATTDVRLYSNGTRAKIEEWDNPRAIEGILRAVFRFNVTDLYETLVELLSDDPRFRDELPDAPISLGMTATPQTSVTGFYWECEVTFHNPDTMGLSIINLTITFEKI